MSKSSNRKRIIEDNAANIQRFVLLLQDWGIRSQILEAIARKLPASGGIPREILDDALGGIGGNVGDKFRIEHIVSAAPAFEQLVRYARTLDPDVFPQRLIPGPTVVAACLGAFHEQHKELFRRCFAAPARS